MKIIGTGHSLPKLVVTNDMLAEFLDTSDEWIRTRTGIQERRLLSDETLDELAAQAMRSALDDAGISAKDLDFIICSNVANNMVTPGFGCLLQGRIGATCPTIDINCACSGFVYALNMANAYFKAYDYKNILIICAEQPSRYCNWKERDTSVLFADGAAAVVVNNEGDHVLGFHLNNECNIEPLYYCRRLEPTPFNKVEEANHPLKMIGRAVYKIAIQSSTNDILQVLKKANMNIEDVDYFILHQANERIIKSICKNIGQDIKKFPMNIAHIGNTSSASVPILLDQLRKANTFKEGDIIVFSAFGGGFTTGAGIYKW
jgi:3-oxoacyl-[acyl-carrier-protein] synthase-3